MRKLILLAIMCIALVGCNKAEDKDKVDIPKTEHTDSFNRLEYTNDNNNVEDKEIELDNSELEAEVAEITEKTIEAQKNPENYVTHYEEEIPQCVHLRKIIQRH